MDFWSDLDKTGQANFEILPENLYRLHGGNAVLDCSWVSPVVRRMQVFLNINDDPASYGSYHTAPMRALGDLLFETDYGPERFIMGNPDWLTGAGSVLFGQGASVEQKVTDLLNNPSINAGFGEGLSPFMTFHIDLSGYRTQDPNPALVHPIISDMSEMVVVFDLEYRTAAAGVRDVGTCH